MEPIPWCADGFLLPPGVELGKHPDHAAGLYYLQDPSAMAVAELLDPQPGEVVLDLAAAPGGKATHIASRLQGQGFLVANEIHPQRAWELAGNLERWGARNVAITNERPERLAERLAGFFDRVLVDAPCSGEGMLHRSEAARQEWAPERIGGCALRQSAILSHAARLVRPGGRLVYATCTFNPEENEGTVARFLSAHPDFELLEPPRLPGFASGRPEWLQSDSSNLLTRTVRLWPHLAPGEGHFIAVMRRGEARSDARPPAALTRSRRGQRTLPQAAERAYHTFCQAHLTGVPTRARLALVGSYLYALPEQGLAPADLVGLRFLHPGWWLGTIKTERFEPSHALALGLRAEDARRVVALNAAAPQTAAYLRGQPVVAAGEDGWVLITVDGFPLGWGKRVAGVVKSHYPRGLRWI